MKPQQFLAGGTALVCVLALAVGLSQAQSPRPEQVSMPLASVGSAFTYQGYLTDGGNPASGAYDFQFTLYNALSGGSQVGSIVAKSSITVTKGLFTVALDFGSVFDGTGLWLEVAVRPVGGTGYTILSPRQEITPSPYALSLKPGAHIQGDGTSAILGGDNTGVYATGYVGVDATGYVGVNGSSNSSYGYGGYFYNTAGGVDVAAMGSGIIKSTADTQIVVSPFDLRAWSWSNVSVIADDQGYAYLRTSASGVQKVYLPVTLPAQVFGVRQKVKSIKVCYQLDDASSYIDITEAYYNNYSGVGTSLLVDDTDRTSTSWTCYTSNDSTPDPIQGAVVVIFWLNYAGTEASHDIVIGSITLTLTEN